MAVFRNIETTLEEDEDGQWCKRRVEVEREVRHRVPDFQVVVGFSQQKAGDSSSLVGHSVPQATATRVALLVESAQRLLWMYHQYLPSLAAEARFDVGKLLLNFSDALSNAEGNEEKALDPAASLHTIRQLHVLRLLKESDQFAWTGKPGRITM